MSERIYINDNWKFTQQYEESMQQADYNDQNLPSVRLPHTCKEVPFHYFDEKIYQMVSGYRRKIYAPKSWQGRRVILTVDGAAHESEVFLNGKKIGEHHCGYTAWSMELTRNLKLGEENILVVKVDSRESVNIPPFGHVIDYMTYGGIYRDVYLDVKEQNYLRDVFVHSKVKTGARPKVWAFTETRWKEEAKDCILRQYIRRKGSEDYQKVWEEGIKGKKCRTSFRVQAPELWDTEHPALYEIKTELVQGEKVLDEKVVVCGFRKAEFKTDGFYLNDRKVKLRGLNRHQSYPYVGYAMPRSMQELDADILKRELGLNAVRTSHYPQSHYFLDRCDEIGLLVFTEIPGWQHIGDQAWKDQAVKNVRDMVMQYRNHTSIILWGVRINESQDDDAFYRRTNDMAHKLDPYRPTGGVRFIKKSSLLEDVYTYNDFSHDGRTPGCEKKLSVTPDPKKAYLISEYNGHMYPTKAYDCEEHQTSHAIRHANVLEGAAGQTDIAGSFGWCMFDYHTHKDFGSGDRICYHGVMDMFRNPKMAAEIYACQQEERPVLSLSSSMDIGEHPGCNRGLIWIFTNADSVRMYKNGYFLKEYTREDSPYKHLKHGPIAIDDFIGDLLEKQESMKPAQAKEVKNLLNTVARYGLTNLPKSVYPRIVKLLTVYRMKPAQAVELYNRYVGDWGGTSTVYSFEAVKDGKVVKTITKKPMESLHLNVEADHVNLQEDHTYDVAAVRIRALDENENLLSFYQEPVLLELEGEAELIGPKVIALQGGMGGTYIKTKGKAGTARLKIKAAQAEEVEISFEIRTGGRAE
ncbi:MAG: glycoside hydrolase family 2 protein [Lachnospiraceae bacterium]|nr:glycoside hydrolase family 2 protein [Lachnospiraceae bacterium]